MTTMKSVPLPVSRLMSSSETMNEEPGDTICAMRSMASLGMTMRSSAALAAAGSVATASAWRPVRRWPLTGGGACEGAPS